MCLSSISELGCNTIVHGVHRFVDKQKSWASNANILASLTKAKNKLKALVRDCKRCVFKNQPTTECSVKIHQIIVFLFWHFH